MHAFGVVFSIRLSEVLSFEKGVIKIDRDFARRVELFFLAPVFQSPSSPIYL